MFTIADFEKVRPEWRGGYLAVGNFDGVHRGHVELVKRLRERADSAGTRAIVLTFDPRPVAVLRPTQAPPPLMWTARKIELLKEAGAADVGVFATGPWLLELTARDFFDRVLRHQFEATGIVEGPTFGFGRDRGGDVALLAEWCAGAEIDLTVVPPTVFDGDLISSTRIRKALLAGRVAQTTRWLSRPYRIRGTVVRGAARGAGLGFPTANLDNIEVLIPADGVYAGRAAVAGRSYGAAVHVGPNATFDETKRGVEVHLLDFNGNLYGQQIELDFIEYLRPTRQFGGVDALLAQIQQDVSLARRILTQTSD